MLLCSRNEGRLANDFVAARGRRKRADSTRVCGRGVQQLYSRDGDGSRRAPFRRRRPHSARHFCGVLLFTEFEIWSERNAAQNFQVASGSYGRKALARWWSGTCGIQAVGNLDELVGIRALIAVTADCGGNRVDGCGAVLVHDAGDVPKTIRGGRPGKSGDGIVSGGIFRDDVRSAEVKSVLQSVSEIPLLRGGIEYPLLQSRGRLSSGIRVGVGVG